MKYVTMSLSIVFLALMTATVFAGSMPDYKCAEQNTRCEKACDEMAEGSKNANAYQRCLDRCQEANQRCEERQSKTTGCAEAFMDCTKEAAGNEEAQEGCREAYRLCKDN
ncbi:MAG: hypothetical protein AB7D06_14585 [Pedobacter sp.]